MSLGPLARWFLIAGQLGAMLTGAHFRGELGVQIVAQRLFANHEQNHGF